MASTGLRSILGQHWTLCWQSTPQLVLCTTTSTEVRVSRRHSVQACLVMGPAQRSAAGAGHIGDGAACVHNDSESSRGCPQLQCGVEVPAAAEAGGWGLEECKSDAPSYSVAWEEPVQGTASLFGYRGWCAQGVSMQAGPRVM